MAIATYNDVVAALNLSPTAEEQTQINALLEPVSAAIEKLAGMRWGATLTEYHPGGRAIFLGSRPVDSVSALVDLATGENLATLSPAAYELDAVRGIIRPLPYGSAFGTATQSHVVPDLTSKTRQRWKVTYASGPPPEEVKLIFYAAMRAQLNQLEEAARFASEKDGDYAYARAPRVNVEALLDTGALQVLRSYQAGAFV